MGKRYVISLMAANRVGIMASVTTALDELGGDLEEVSQTVMQKFFTIILSARFPEHRDQEVIVDHIRAVCRPFGVEVSLKDPDAEVLQEAAEGETEKYFLVATGEDRPGAIRKIAHRLAQDSIDIVDFYGLAREEHEFIAIMELAVPIGLDALALQRELEELGHAIGLSATLQHENIFIATSDPRPVRLSRLVRQEMKADAAP